MPWPTACCLQTEFDRTHAQYLPCGYGKDCKYGSKCTRAHSDPPQAEIAYWNEHGARDYDPKSAYYENL